MKSTEHSKKPVFTERDLALLQLIVDGWTDKEIAASTRCSPGSIRVYLHYLYRKMGVSTRTQAAMSAIRRGLATNANELENQPAYPVPSECGRESGLTKREAAAIAAMQGLLSTPTDDSFYSEDGQKAKTMDDNYRYCAKFACGYADALLAELARTEG